MLATQRAAMKLRPDGFTFKQFFVGHGRCAMKVGTDGVLLGAWAPVEKLSRVLDIGTGSGLIALMLAQRSASDVRIDAVELESDAAQQAEENVQRSPWAPRIDVHQTDIQQFAHTSPHHYQLIVSNPPYFPPAVACRDQARNQARYTTTLTHPILLQTAEKLLDPLGHFCLVLPHILGVEFEQQALQQGWYRAQRVDVCDRDDKPFHRMLLALTRHPAPGSTTTPPLQLAIRRQNGEYSTDFRCLIGDFYLNY